MSDKQNPGQKSVVTLGEANGGPPSAATPVVEVATAVHKDAMVKDDLAPPVGGFKSDKRDWYNLGVLPGCPFQTVHVGLKGGFVVAFTKNAETLLINRETRTTERSKRRGDFAALSKEEHEELLAKVKRRVIRWVSKENHRGMILDMDAKRYPDGAGSYSQEQGDEPLGRYLFCNRVSADTVEIAMNPLGNSMSPISG